jgi:hypothetical protein
MGRRLMLEEIPSSNTSVLTSLTRRHISEDDILHFDEGCLDVNLPNITLVILFSLVLANVGNPL